MPTNRGWMRLTPAGAPHPTRDYLKAQPPACSTLGASLAVLALFIVICLGARRLAFRRRSSCSSISAYPLVACTSENVESETTKKGSGPVVNEKGREDGKTGNAVTMGGIKHERVRLSDSHGIQTNSPLAIDPQWVKVAHDPPLTLMSRPPPAPPLTPPELSTSVFTFTRRPQSQDSFMHQPNPDYLDSTDSPASQPSSGSPPTDTRRQSYTRLIPGGPSASQTSSPIDQEPSEVSLLSSSYPPTTTLLPPPPPGLQQVEDASQRTRQIEVQGEIISVLDSEGAGWTRHTRVYGGGVCLACAASGGSHGGGFYGANVSPEEMH